MLDNYVITYIPLLGHCITRGQLDAALAEAGEMAAFDPAQANNVTAIQTTKARVLILHGEDDDMIPPKHARSSVYP